MDLQRSLTLVRVREALVNLPLVGADTGDGGLQFIIDVRAGKAASDPKRRPPYQPVDKLARAPAVNNRLWIAQRSTCEMG
jgi:hypothetical protein